MDSSMVSGSAVKAASVLVAGLLLACGRTQEGPQEAEVGGGAGLNRTPVTAGATGGGGSPNGGSRPTGGGEQGGGSGGTVFDPSFGGAGQAGMPPRASAGCNVVPSQDAGIWKPYSVHVPGNTLDPTFTVPEHDRAYGVWLPRNYVAEEPHRVVFTDLVCGSSGVDNTELTSTSVPVVPNVIFVGLGAPPASVQQYGCADTSGLQSTEWEYFALVATAVEKAFCVDKNDELVFGRRSGGTLANMLGCYFAGFDPARKFGPDLSLRGQIAAGGALPKEWPSCGGPIAAMWLHDPNETPPLSDAQLALDHVLAQNGCPDRSTAEVMNNGAGVPGCKQYLSCGSEHPVVFCETPDRGRQSNYISLVAPALAEFTGLLNSP